MHLIEPDCQVIQAQHLHERENDAPRLLGLRRLNRHEKALHQDQGRQS